MASLSAGIELQPPGVDQRWVRIWVVDAAARPIARCRLVVRSAEGRPGKRDRRSDPAHEDCRATHRPCDCPAETGTYPSADDHAYESTDASDGCTSPCT